MTTELHTLDTDILATLRACRLPVGAEFVRCGRHMGMSGAATMAHRIRDAFDDDESGVFHAYNAETGHEDYVRVDRGTNAFRAICQMKS